MASVTLEKLTKTYAGGQLRAVNELTLDIADGEFLVLVGPSGCGKSTALRMIAGLEEITDGGIWIGDQFVNDVHPKDRDIAMVFQNYALYPHMSRLRQHRLPAADREGCRRRRSDKRVVEAARILELEHYLKRRPGQLSGGQRQRVAMGRAIVRQPVGLPDGRAALEPRRQAPRPDARRDRAAAAPARHDDDLRHPRPGRGDDDGPPRGADAATACCSRSIRPTAIYDRPATSSSPPSSARRR